MRKTVTGGDVELLAQVTLRLELQEGVANEGKRQREQLDDAHDVV